MTGAEMERIGNRILAVAAILWGVVLVGMIFSFAFAELYGWRGRPVWPMFCLGGIGLLLLIGGPMSLIGQHLRYKEEDRRRY